MISLERNSLVKSDIELEIMNSNTKYNILSKNKRTVDIEDIKKEFKEMEQYDTIRMLIKNDESYIGIVDYTLSNPSDSIPWISLFVIHKDFHGLGHASEAYNYVENVIGQSNKNVIRLAILKENIVGINFWSKLGYKTFKEARYDEKVHLCMEKELKNIE